MKSKELTGFSDKHVAFIGNVLAGDMLDAAAKKAGISTPARDAYPVLMEPEVIKHIRGRVSGKAATEGLVVCYNYFIEVVRDKARPDRQRLEAAKFLYGHHMPAVKAQDVGNTNAKEVSEMNNTELHDFVVGMEAELKSRLNKTQGVDDMI